MATDRALPTLRISAEQLEERTKLIQQERKYYDAGVKHRSKDDAVAARVPKMSASTRTHTTIGNDQMAGTNPNRRRGQRRRGHIPIVREHTTRVDEQYYVTRRGGRNEEDNGHVTGGRDEDLLTAWKRCCSAGGTEKLIASWMETRSRSKFTVILNAVTKFASLSERLVLKDLEMSMKMDLVSRLWKHGHYPVIEGLRKIGEEVSCDLDEFLRSSDMFYSSLLEQLQTAHSFTLTQYTSGRLTFPSKTRQRVVLQAVHLCHHCCIHLGDLSRYSEQLSSSPNWGKPRNYYLKARELAPKDGRPYNQLAVVALRANHRLDAIYYYMRSLMAKNPFKSAHDSLVGLFEDTATKVKKQEEEDVKSKLKAERGAVKKQRRQQRHKQRQQQSVGGHRVGGRREESREVWIMPGHEQEVGVVSNGTQVIQDDLESLSNTELLRKLVSCFLIAHGKIFTKIGIETMDSTLSHLSHLLIRHLTAGGAHASVSDAYASAGDAHALAETQRLVQMTAINVFSIHHAVDSHVDNVLSQHFYCGRAMSLSLQLTTILLQHCVNTLQACPIMPSLDNISRSDSSPPLEPSAGVKINPLKSCDQPAELKVVSEYPKDLIVCLDVFSVLLPAVRVWLQWLLRQKGLWTQWLEHLDKSAMFQFWTVLCSFLNLSLSVVPGLTLITTDTDTAGSVCPLRRFWEDRMLAGFIPLGNTLSTQDILSISELKTLDKQQLRDQAVQRIADISRLSVDLSSLTNYGLIFDPVSVKFDISERVSDLIKGSPPPPLDDVRDTDSVSSDDVLVDSSSAEEEEGGGSKDEEDITTETLAEIAQLKAHKERLTKKMVEHTQALQIAKNVLDEAAHSEQAVRRISPKYLVPDTNCFVDLLPSIQSLIATTQFIIAVPLVVLSELEGLSKGSGEGQNSAHVTAGSRSAVELVQSRFAERCVQVRALTTQGSLLPSISFRAEVTDKASNDDLILTSCLQLHSKVDSGDRLSVVLLTDDRNLRVKAHASNLPVKDMPSFMKLLE